MPNDDTCKRPAFGRWAGTLILGLTLFGGEPLAVQQPLGPGGTPLVTGRTAASADATVIGSDMLVSGAEDGEGPRIRLAGGLRLGVGLGGVGVGLYGPTYGRNYCDQPGYCYPAPRVVHEEALPRRVQRRAAVPKVAQPRRKVRAAQAAKPKHRLVRSLAAAPEPVAEAGTPYGPGRAPRGGSPVAAGDSTGGGRATPQFRGPSSGGGGPITVGETSGGGRVTPTFRTVPSGGGRVTPTVRTVPSGARRR
jgi:hypothetical protein